MSQWSNYGKPDPLVPFNEARLGELSSLLGEGAADSRDVVLRMRQLTGQSANPAWSGLAADAFFTEIGDMPEDLGKLIQSYGHAHVAVRDYVADLKVLQHRADTQLEVVIRHDKKIATLRWELSAVPLEEEDRRQDLESMIEALDGSLNREVQQADIILGDLDDAADSFRRAMAVAQDLGIHNRTILVRFYQDHIEVWVEATVGAWEELGPLILAAGVVLSIPPFTPIGAGLILASKIVGGIVLVAQGIDILLSDDDADFWFFFDGGVMLLAGGKKVAGHHLISQMKEGISLVDAGGTGAFKIISRVSKVVDVVDAGKDVVGFVNFVDSDKPYLDAMADSLWDGRRNAFVPFVTTPTLIDIVVDVVGSSDEI